MALAFDCPSAFASYQWESVSDSEWQDCFEDMVSQSRESLSGSGRVCAENEEAEECLEGVLAVESSEKMLQVKRIKLMQLVLLHEVWARTGTDREAFYKYLSLLQAPSSLDASMVSPDLYKTLRGIKMLLGSENQLKLAGGITQSQSWYDIIEKTIARLPGNIPVMMTGDSPLFNLLSILERSNSTFPTKGKQAQVSEKLSALLKQSRFLTDFKPLGFIGKGGFGTVLKAEKKSEDLTYAIKIIRFTDFAVPSKRFQRVFREVTTLARLDHVNVVRYYSAWLELTEEYNDLLSGLNPPKREGNETPSDEYEDEEYSEEYSEDEFGLDDYLEDDMSEMSIMMPVGDDDDEDFESIANPRSHCMLSIGDDEEKMYIYGGGSVQVGFKGKSPKRCQSSHTVFEKPKMWKANSSRSLIPTNSALLRRSIPSTRVIARRSSRRRMKGIRCEPVSVSSTSHSLITAKQFDYTLFIQMQLYEHATLKQWLVNPGREINKKDNLKIFKQIISGLQHVHQHGLLHRDLKPANIFLSKSGIIKIGDFGLSRDLQSPSKVEDSTTYAKVSKKKPFFFNSGSGESKHTASVGTPGYVAPEILNEDNYGPKIDVYSLGIILMELFSKITTKHEKGACLMQLRDRIAPKAISENYPDMAKLILQMTHPNPEERIDLDTLATIIDKELDDTTALRTQIEEQQKIIDSQAAEIARLIEENRKLKQQLSQ